MTAMTAANAAVYTRIQKPEEYQVSFDHENNIGIAIHGERGYLILAVDRNTALTMAVDLMKRAVFEIKQDVNKEITDLTFLKMT